MTRFLDAIVGCILVLGIVVMVPMAILLWLFVVAFVVPLWIFLGLIANAVCVVFGWCLPMKITWRKGSGEALHAGD